MKECEILELFSSKYLRYVPDPEGVEVGMDHWGLEEGDDMVWLEPCVGEDGLPRVVVMLDILTRDIAPYLIKALGELVDEDDPSYNILNCQGN